MYFLYRASKNPIHFPNSATIWGQRNQTQGDMDIILYLNPDTFLIWDGTKDFQVSCGKYSSGKIVQVFYEFRP